MRARMVDIKAAMAKKTARKSRRVEKLAESQELAQIANGLGPSLADSASNSDQGVKNAAPRGGPSGAVFGSVGQTRTKTDRKKKKKKSPTLSKLKKLLWDEIVKVVYAQNPLCLTCGSDAPPVACHIVPSHEGAATRFFLPNLYRGCATCNLNEKWNRGKWAILIFPAFFGEDYVDALYDMSSQIFDLDKSWVIEQTERMRKLRGIA